MNNDPYHNITWTCKEEVLELVCAGIGIAMERILRGHYKPVMPHELETEARRHKLEFLNGGQNAAEEENAM